MKQRNFIKRSGSLLLIMSSILLFVACGLAVGGYYFFKNSLEKERIPFLASSLRNKYTDDEAYLATLAATNEEEKESFVEKEIGGLVKKELERTDEVDKKTWKEIALQQLKLFDKKLSNTVERMERKIEKDFKTMADDAKKNIIDDIASKMVTILESRLTGSDMQLRNNEARKFNLLFEELKRMQTTYDEQLKALDKKLAAIQRAKMGERRSQRFEAERAISQSEIDEVIKREVNNQLRDLRFNNDPRVKRLKKVVALEKMRRLLRAMSDGAEEFDF